MRVEELSAMLHRNKDGIYVSTAVDEVSYAADGHSRCFDVEDGSFWFRHRNNCIAHMVANHPFPRGALLDIGGGNGYVAQRLVTEGHEVVLVEPGPTGARNARLVRQLDHVVCATVEQAAFRPGSFGAIGMFDVIEHIEEDRKFLADISPLLIANGRLYLTIPCHQWLWSQADIDAGHFRRHTEASLQALLGGIFRIDYLSYFFRPLVLPQFLLRALPFRLGIGRNNAVMSTEAEHGSGNGVAVRMLTRMLEHEARTISDDKSIGFGASCLVAATRL